MFKVLAYVLLLLAVLPVLFFASLAAAMPSPHGIVPTVLAAIIAPLPFVVPVALAAGVFLCIHRYLHPRPRPDYEASEYTPPLRRASQGPSDTDRAAISAFGRY